MTALQWIEPDEPLPDPEQALTDPEGLLCAGLDIGPTRLLEAYRKGIFPWYNQGQPVLWWSPDPRMVLHLDEFRLHRSLRKRLARVRREGRWQLRLDCNFRAVMQACAEPREGQDGTWITDAIIGAYCGLHDRGLAHSIEVHEDGQMIAGLYGVALGRMFFGESMFTRRTDASKLAFVALVKALIRQGFRMIDCQQNTRHLASFGAREIPRRQFVADIGPLMDQSPSQWQQMCDAEGHMDWPEPGE